MIKFFSHLFNKKSDKEVDKTMEKDEKKTEETTKSKSAISDDAKPETPESAPKEPETDKNKGEIVGNVDIVSENPENSEHPAASSEAESKTDTENGVSRQEFDELKANIADIKALLQNLPKTSELVDPAGQQELDKLTALQNKWNN